MNKKQKAIALLADLSDWISELWAGTPGALDECENACEDLEEFIMSLIEADESDEEGNPVFGGDAPDFTMAADLRKRHNPGKHLGKPLRMNPAGIHNASTDWIVFFTIFLASIGLAHCLTYYN